MAWIYNDSGRGVVVFDASELSNMGTGKYFEVPDDKLPNAGKEIKTDGVSWWYEKPTADIKEESEPIAAEDIMTMTVDHEYRLTLLELGITEV